MMVVVLETLKTGTEEFVTGLLVIKQWHSLKVPDSDAGAVCSESTFYNEFKPSAHQYMTW